MPAKSLSGNCYTVVTVHVLEYMYQIVLLVNKVHALTNLRWFPYTYILSVLFDELFY